MMCAGVGEPPATCPPVGPRVWERTLHPHSAVLGGATGEECETAPDSQVICSLPNLLQEIVKKFYTQLQ